MILTLFKNNIIFYLKTSELMVKFYMDDKTKNNKEKTTKSEHSQYIETQLNMVAEVISNTIKHITSIEIKGLTKILENTIEKLSKNADLLPLVKDTVENTVKFLTTDQVNKIIKSVENMPEEEIKNLVYDMLSLQYKFLESTYNGFLSFVINKMSEHEDDPQPSEYVQKQDDTHPVEPNRSIRDEITHLASLFGLSNDEDTASKTKSEEKHSGFNKDTPLQTNHSDDVKMKPSEIYFESKKDKRKEFEQALESDTIINHEIDDRK